MIIANNVSALFSQRHLGLNEASAAKTMEKLSSGSAINRAADNSSNLAVSEKMRAQIRGLNQASTNVQNGVSFIQTAESYLESTTSVLQRLRELAIQAANGIYSDEDRLYIQVEVSQLVDEVSRVASHAQFNGMNLLTGRFSRNAQAMTLHVGANLDQSLSVYLEDMSDRALGLRDEQSKLDLSDAESANRAISTLDEAMRKVNKQRADLGAYQNRAEAAKRGIDVAAENLTASESRIRDADYAKEMVSFTRDLILQQASTAMLSHANAKNDLVLSLLR